MSAPETGRRSPTYTRSFATKRTAYGSSGRNPHSHHGPTTLNGLPHGGVSPWPIWAGPLARPGFAYPTLALIARCWNTLEEGITEVPGVEFRNHPQPWAQRPPMYPEAYPQLVQLH